MGTDKKEYIITEGVEGYWHYHLSLKDHFTRSLCGKHTMTTAISLKEWGKKSHLNERWCSKCWELKDDPTQTIKK